jgi:hypothetical protein
MCGWAGLDPTNALMIGNDHTALPKGRGRTAARITRENCPLPTS